jgi:drug/metabolite transporter (DMT)-like permease
MTQTTAACALPRARSLTPFDFLLYASVVALWGTSWIALHLQLGVVAPEVSLVWRFSLAALIMVGWVTVQRTRMRFGPADHLRFVALGLTIFSTNFVFFYYGGLSTPSGLLAVVFSLAAVFNMLMGAAIFGERPGARVVVAAIMGFVGVGAMFEPQIAGANFTSAGLLGLVFCVAGTILFCLGNMVSVSSQRRGVPIASATAWGMIYGAGFLAILSLARGQTFTVEPTFSYLAALLWLSTMASVLAFAAYMTLLSRIGADRTGYSTVLYPVIALGISTVLEGYVWTWPALAGLVLVLGGNLLMLTRSRQG